jgi:hypothetical protein
MLESSTLIILPRSSVVRWVEDQRMIELFCLDVSEVLIDLHLPFVEDLNLGETLNQGVDAVVSVFGLSDHIGAQVSHLIGVSGETLREGCLVAS